MNEAQVVSTFITGQQLSTITTAALGGFDASTVVTIVAACVTGTVPIRVAWMASRKALKAMQNALTGKRVRV